MIDYLQPHRPIRIEFAEQAIKITLRIVHMTRGEDASRGLSISTSYCHFDGSKLLLTRREVTVTSDRQAELGDDDTSFMKNKFDTTFRRALKPNLNLSQFPRYKILGSTSSNFPCDRQGWLQVSIP